MADPADRSITADQLRGMKQLRRVAGLLSRSHKAGCDRDKAANRQLHFDDYVLLILLYLFNPMIDSMRTLQKVSDLPEIQRRLGIKRFSLGSFSESCRVFDPAMLQAVVDQLAGDLLPVQRAALLRDRLAHKYPWSSAAVHCREPDAGGLLDSDSWKSLSRGLDWRAELADGIDPSELRRLRQNWHTGRPLANDAFLAKLEKTLGRRLRPRRQTQSARD